MAAKPLCVCGEPAVAHVKVIYEPIAPTAQKEHWGLLPLCAKHTGEARSELRKFKVQSQAAQKKSPPLLPKCRFCGRRWKPPQGVVASRSYCTRCRAERRAIANQRLELRPLSPDQDLEGKYLRLRRQR